MPTRKAAALSQKKKVISFSLWGTTPMYTVGAVKNAELAPKIYPGWICRFYVSNDVPPPILDELSQFSHVEIVEMHATSRSCWNCSICC